MTDKKRKSFVLHLDVLSVLDDLTDEQAGKLFKAIKANRLDEELELDAITKIAFSPFKAQFVRDDEKYQKIVERNKNNGSKGGRPSNPEEPKKPSGLYGNPKNPEKADSDSDSVNDKDINIRQPKVAKCPHEDIVNLYHEILPELPKVKMWTPKRQGYLRTVWNGNESRQNIDYWKRFFNYVKQSDFLTGRGSEFKADLEWLVKPANFLKIIEKKYENRN